MSNGSGFLNFSRLTCIPHLYNGYSFTGSRAGNVISVGTLLWVHRKMVKTAAMNYDRLLMKRTLKWLHRRRIEGKSSPKLRARTLALRAQGFQERWRLRYFWLYWIEGRRGDHHYQQFLLKRSCKALREVPFLPPSLSRPLTLQKHASARK